ncbi:MFS transporter [Penicillium macrosclerotiorum]|uniref:MFS transporter n=1 Tax=Penicillium macrosclerotiorum TaxID=303699 RepID=UPI0025471759|nr:MFS transporter [Penicillium macrosclerotiorum]KAJ5698359.1 MFS transporter [Penicillium macrosclerotiorum]
MIKKIEIPEPQAIPLYDVKPPERLPNPPGYHRWQDDDFADREHAFYHFSMDDEKELKPYGKELSKWKLVSVTVALCSAMFCVSLDGTILATAIPKITNAFGSLDDVGWYGSAYLFTNCAVQLLFGKLYTFYSVKWVFLTGLLIFEVGSLICGTAATSSTLIIGRSIAGLGSAGLFAGALIIVSSTVPLRVRPIYVGLVSSMHGVASIAGPILGGAFTQYLTWRWCFFINLPLGGLTCLLILFLVPGNESTLKKAPWREQFKEFDLPGTLTLIPAVICMILALQWGGSKYAWSDVHVVSLFVVFGLLFAVFIAIQIFQKDRATIPLRMMKNRNICGAAWYALCISPPMFLIAYYLPIWFQAIKGVTATQSGIDTLPSLLGLVVFAIIAGGLSSTTGYYTPLVLLSSVMTAISVGLLTTLQVDSGTPHWFGYQVLLAAGLGFGIQNVMLVAQVAVPESDMAMVTSILSFVQTLAGSLFLSIGESVFANRLISNLKARLPDVNGAEVVASGATGIRNHFTPKQLPIVLQAYNKAIVQTFYVGVVMASLSIFGPIFMEWLSIKKTADEREKRDNMAKKRMSVTLGAVGLN